MSGLERYILIIAAIISVICVFLIINLQRNKPTKNQKKALKSLARHLRRTLYVDAPLLEEYGTVIGFKVRVKGRYLYVYYYVSNNMDHELVPPAFDLVLQFYDRDGDPIRYQSKPLGYEELRLSYYSDFFMVDVLDIENACNAALIAE